MLSAKILILPIAIPVLEKYSPKAAVVVKAGIKCSAEAYLCKTIGIIPLDFDMFTGSISAASPAIKSSFKSFLRPLKKIFQKSIK